MRLQHILLPGEARWREKAGLRHAPITTPVLYLQQLGLPFRLLGRLARSKHSRFRKGVCAKPRGRGKRRGFEAEEILKAVLFAKQALPKLKDIGDKSAHIRRFNALRGDIQPLLSDIRTVVEELLYVADLK